MNEFLSAYVALQNRFAAAARSRHALGMSPSRRAAGMLEYVLLGAIAAVIIGVVMREQLADIVEGLLDRVRTSVNDSGS